MEDNLKKAIEQMKNGEEQGFNEVYSQTYNRVYFRAKQIMKKEEDAQDLTQIVFVEAYKGITSLQSSEAIYSWLDGITYRQGMKIFRKQKDVLLTEEAEGLFETLENNDIDTVPELTADQKATSDIIRGILEELPELQKTAVVMYYFDGMKVEQIAEVMECSANTIKSRLNYARKYLKDRVEEKERKEGYRLHVVGFPVLWFAIKTLSEQTTLTLQNAQGVYEGACTSIGLQASIIAASETAGTMGAEAAIAGAGAGEAAKAAGIGAKFAALSTGVKTLIIAGAAAILGAGVIGTVYLVNAAQTEDVFSIENSVPEEAPLEDNMSEYLRVYADADTRRFLKATKISDTEYCFYSEDLAEAFEQNEEVRLATFLPDNLGIYAVEMTLDETYNNIPKIMNEYKDITFKIYTQHDIIVKIDYIDNVVYEEENTGTSVETTAETTAQTETEEVQKYEVTEQAARQISSFVAAAYQCNYSAVNNGAGWNIFSMTPDDCLFFLKDYIGMVNAQIGMKAVAPNPTDLPFGWSSGSITEEEAADFFQYGLGIEIPAGYSYSFSNDVGSLKLANGMLESTFDGRTLQVAGGSVKIESQDANSIVLSGTCAWYDPEETLYQFTVTGVPSGNPDVFGGITITNIEIGGADSGNASEVDYQLMAEKCAEIIQEKEATYGLAFGGYYLNDIDKDGIPELIVTEGTCNADYRNVVYKFDGTKMVRKGDAMYGTIYGNATLKGIYIQYFHMDYEEDEYFDLISNIALFSGENKMGDDGYIAKYKFPEGTFMLTLYQESDTDSVYENIMQVVD